MIRSRPGAADLRALETADTNGDGIPEIVDAWGHPVRFYRWPTRLVRPAPSQSSLGNSGPIDEIYQASGTPQPPPVTIAPTPLMLAMGGAAPRVSLPVWAASTSYSVGSSIVSGVTYPNTGFSLTYQCTAIAPTNSPPASALSASTAPSWPTSSPAVGATLTDGSSPNNLTWQAFLDPLSVDPDDPNGLVTSGLIGELQQNGVTGPETPNTWNVPLIISPGPDETLGLYEPYDNANFGNLSQPQFDTTDATGFLRRHVRQHHKSPEVSETRMTTRAAQRDNLPCAGAACLAKGIGWRPKGFTLIELMVSISIVLVLATLTFTLLNVTLDSDRLKGGSRELQSFLTGARDRAVYAGQPRGVRLLPDPADPSTVRSFTYIGAPSNYTDGSLIQIAADKRTIIVVANPPPAVSPPAVGTPPSTWPGLICAAS